MLNGSNASAALQTDGRVVGSEATRTKSSTRRDVITAERLNRRCRRPPLKECSSPFFLSSSLPLTFLAFSPLAFVFGGCGAEEKAVIKIRGPQSHRSDSGKDLAGISTGGERIKNVSLSDRPYDNDCDRYEGIMSPMLSFHGNKCLPFFRPGRTLRFQTTF